MARSFGTRWSVLRWNRYRTGRRSIRQHITKYSYIGDPAWNHHDNEVVKSKDRTWGQFRGFAQVNTLFGHMANTTSGVADSQTLTEYRYFPGRNGDTNAALAAPPAGSLSPTRSATNS